MRANTQEAFCLPTWHPSESARRAKLPTMPPNFAGLRTRSVGLNEIACYFGLTERQERRKRLVRSGGAGSEGLRFGFASSCPDQFALLSLTLLLHRDYKCRFLLLIPQGRRR